MSDRGAGGAEQGETREDFSRQSSSIQVASGSAGSTTELRQTPRRSRPKTVDANYPVAKMTYLTISTEDLAALALSSGVGSIGLSGSIYLWGFLELANLSKPMSVAFTLFLATTIAGYLYFGGLVYQIRRRSGLTGWNIFSE